MTLANAASRSVTSQIVQHDNAPALKAAWTAAYAAHGGVVTIPIIPGNTTLTFPFNSTTDLSVIPNPTAATVKLVVAIALLNQPWVLAGFSELEGTAQTSTSFQYSPLGSIGGNTHPLILLNRNSAGGIKISKIKFATGAVGQSSVLLDQRVGGGGIVGVIFDDDGFSGNAAPAVIVKGGFDFWFTHGVCGVGGSENTQWYAHPCIQFTNASTYLSSIGTQIPGRIYFERSNFQGGTGMQLDNIPASNQPATFTTGGGNIFLNGVLHDLQRRPAPSHRDGKCHRLRHHAERRRDCGFDQRNAPATAGNDRHDRSEQYFCREQQGRGTKSDDFRQRLVRVACLHK